jgi:hypothetical protein
VTSQLKQPDVLRSFDSAHRPSVAIRVKLSCRTRRLEAEILWGESAATGPKGTNTGESPLGTLGSDKNDRRGAASLSKIAHC